MIQFKTKEMKMKEFEEQKKKKKKKKEKKNLKETEKLEVTVIDNKKVDALTQMKRDIKKLETLTKNISVAKRNALNANAKLEKLLQAKRDIEIKYNL